MPPIFSRRVCAFCIAVVLCVVAVLSAAYFHDNKYAVAAPRGANGVFAFSTADLARPLVLTDGWLMELDGVSAAVGDEPRETFAGQYSNFSYVPGSSSPFGHAVYTVVLRAVDAGGPVALTLFVPEVFGSWTLSADGVPVARDADGPFASVTVDGQVELLLDVESAGGYYSGLVYPPVAGTAEVMATWQAVRTAVSGAACLIPLVLGVIACAVWVPRRADVVLALFAGMCLALAGACFGPFAYQLGWVGSWQHAVEDALWMAVLSCAAALAAYVAGLTERRWCRLSVLPLLATSPVVAFVAVGAGIPVAPALIEPYAMFQTVFRAGAGAFAVVCAAASLHSKQQEGSFVVCGAVVMALSFVASLLDAGSYEPLYGLWQVEYAGLFLMVVFAALIAARGRRLVAQEAEARQMAVQLAAAERTVAHIRASEDATRVLRHDLKHHADALAALLDEEAWERARAYVHDLSEGWASVPPVRYSQNLVVNAACATYLGQAAAEGVQVDCRASVPEEVAVADGDLAVLLANLLSNAVEGCRRVENGRPRVLRFEARLEDGALCLRCENTAPRGQADGRTSKRDADVHGFGLSSMRRIAKRYDGAFLVERRDDSFIARCVLRPKR